MNAEDARYNAKHILGSSLTGHFPFSIEQAERQVAAWSDEEVVAFVLAAFDRRPAVPDPSRGQSPWDFEVRP